MIDVLLSMAHVAGTLVYFEQAAATENLQQTKKQTGKQTNKQTNKQAKKQRIKRFFLQNYFPQGSKRMKVQVCGLYMIGDP